MHQPSSGKEGAKWNDGNRNQRNLLNLLILDWCREGGSNPHGRKGRRILSLFFAILQHVAITRKPSHK